MSNPVKADISVRELVEFILRSGDLDNRKQRVSQKAMAEGIRLHQKIQGSMPASYSSEVRFVQELTTYYKDKEFIIALDGRADGIIHLTGTEERLDYPNTELLFTEAEYVVDEIKCMYADVMKFDEPAGIHLAQAKCYAYMIMTDYGLDRVAVQLTYCNIDSEEIRYFTCEFSSEELMEFMADLLKSYAKWLYWEQNHKRQRDESVKSLQFPFNYRQGQKKLVTDVYLSILRKKKVYIEAPTGVGKTISTMFPAVKAMGEGLCSKVFYVTSKTITRTVANDAAAIMINAGAKLIPITLTAKEKLCVLEKPDCNPAACERAKGHEDRVNDAVYDLICHENNISRDIIRQYADKHMVCPFEFSLDVSLWCDIIIGDYNYVFDPDVSLKRFFNDSHSGSYMLLVDEAHNLVDRAREMYSASLSKDDVLAIRHHFVEREDIKKLFSSLNRKLLLLKKTCDKELTVIDYEENINLFSLAEKLYTKLSSYISDRKVKVPDEVLDFYFKLRTFVMTMGYYNINYNATAVMMDDDFCVSLNCMNPSERLAEFYQYHRSVAFFSATLLPVQYYMDQLGGSEEDYAVYAPSSFDPSKRGIFLATDVSCKYSRRTAEEFEKTAEYIIDMAESKTGNYLVFFPSYKVMNEVIGYLEGRVDMVVQKSFMTEEEREAFLDEFIAGPDTSKVGMCVMGGIFSEGIDLKEDRLIGVAIVGTGLPLVCEQTKMMQAYFDEINGHGFEYSYLYPGMNKVLQAGGRVIRTAGDVGIILLLDERFRTNTYKKLFPIEWNGYKLVNKNNARKTFGDFWQRMEDQNG